MEDAIEKISRELKRCGDFDNLRQKILKQFENSREYTDFYETVEKAYGKVTKNAGDNPDLIELESKVDKFLERNEEWRRLRHRTRKRLKYDGEFNDQANEKILSAISTLEKIDELKFVSASTSSSLRSGRSDYSKNLSTKTHENDRSSSGYGKEPTFLQADSACKEFDTSILFAGNVVAAVLPSKTFLSASEQINSNSNSRSILDKPNILAIVLVTFVDKPSMSIRGSLVYDQTLDKATEFSLDYKMVYRLIGSLQQKCKTDAGDQVLVTRSDFSGGADSYHRVSHFKKGTVLKIIKNSQKLVVQIENTTVTVECDNFINSKQLSDCVFSTLAF